MDNQTFTQSGLETWIKTLKNERALEVSEICSAEDFIDFYGRQLISYEFEENKGICGVLLPSGDFIKCYDSQHSLVSELLTLEEKFLSIFFSSKLTSDDQSTMSFNLNNNSSPFDSTLTRARAMISLGLDKNSDALISTIVTSKQVEFIENHFKYMNPFQQKMVSLYFLERKSEEFSVDKIRDDYYILDKI